MQIREIALEHEFSQLGPERRLYLSVRLVGAVLLLGAVLGVLDEFTVGRRRGLRTVKEERRIQLQCSRRGRGYTRG